MEVDWTNYIKREIVKETARFVAVVKHYSYTANSSTVALLQSEYLLAHIS